jgi:hypothetical protein
LVVGHGHNFAPNYKKLCRFSSRKLQVISCKPVIGH